MQQIWCHSGAGVSQWDELHVQSLTKSCFGVNNIVTVKKLRQIVQMLSKHKIMGVSGLNSICTESLIVHALGIVFFN